MKIILVTQELKDKNKLFKNTEVGSYYTGIIPNKFWGIERIIGGYVGRTDLHKTDGWYDLVYPQPSETEKLGERYFDAENEVYTYYVIPKTPEDLEQEKIQEQQIDKEAIKQKFIDKIVENEVVKDPVTNINYFSEWKAGTYQIDAKVQYKGKPFKNTVTNNTNAPDKGGWVEMKAI